MSGNLITRWRRSIKKRHAWCTKFSTTERGQLKSVINHSSITLPNYVDFAVLQNSVRGVYIFYIYDADYSFIYAFNMASVEYIRYYDSANTLYIECLHDTRFFKTGTRHIRKLTHVFYTCFIKKMKIRGRKWRMYSEDKHRTLRYRFGISHQVWVSLEGLYAKWRRKRRISVFGFDYDYLTTKMEETHAWYPLGEYTERGVYLRNKPYIVRIGKVEKTVVDFRKTEIT